MKRILTGIQSSGTPHLGNIIGAIIPAIQLSKQKNTESLFFIADWHALTTFKSKEITQKNIIHTAAAWLAFGFDYKQNILYRQSDIAEVAEFCWYLSCITPYPMMANAHSFKDKKENLHHVNAGLFTYPILMAADILLYGADKVPVGNDQKQHLEITRDLAKNFNLTFGTKLVVPEPILSKEVGIIPGIDGRKMSKSYGNQIDIFEDENKLKKRIFSIATDSTPIEQPKDPKSCNVFTLIKKVATPQITESIEEKYLEGGYGYGQAKKDLLDIILGSYREERKSFDQYIKEPQELIRILELGAKKARMIAVQTIKEIREKIGIST